MDNSKKTDLYTITSDGTTITGINFPNNPAWIFVDEKENDFWYNQYSQKPIVKEPKPKITRRHKIKDLILAEITKIKLKDYEKSKNIDCVMLGSMDFFGFIQEENLFNIGKFSDLMENGFTWNDIKIKYNKNEERDIFLHYSLSYPMTGVLNIFIDAKQCGYSWINDYQNIQDKINKMAGMWQNMEDKFYTKFVTGTFKP